MKKQFEWNKRAAHVFKVRDKVWLTAKGIKIYQKMLMRLAQLGLGNLD
jgi:hypothetical protein